MPEAVPRTQVDIVHSRSPETVFLPRQEIGIKQVVVINERFFSNNARLRMSGKALGLSTTTNSQRLYGSVWPLIAPMYRRECGLKVQTMRESIELNR